jgi:hypothetical protein
VVVVLGVAWVVSAVRVLGALSSGRPFSVEATLALLALLAIPLAAWRSGGTGGTARG